MFAFTGLLVWSISGGSICKMTELSDYRKIFFPGVFFYGH